MGPSISTNVATEAQKIAIDITNTYTQACQSSSAQDQNISLDKCKGAKIKNVKLTQGSTLNVKCIQNSSTKNQIKQKISERLNQQANSVTQSLGVPSINIATSISTSAENLAEAVANAYTQTCVAQSNQSQGFSCKNSENIDVGVIDFSQGSTTIQDCLQKDSSINTAKVNYERAIGQTASAKQANSFSVALIFFFVLIGFFGIFLIQIVRSEAAKWVIIGIILFLVLLALAYGFNAYENQRWPFQKSN